MKKFVFITAIAISNALHGQIKLDESNKLNIEIETINCIKLSSELELKELYRIEHIDFIENSLGTPNHLKYTDYVAFQSWFFEYDGYSFTVNNKNGFLSIQTLHITPTRTSSIQIGNKVLDYNATLKQFIDSEDNLAYSKNMTNHKIQIVGGNMKTTDQAMELETDITNGRVKRVRIDFND